MSDVRFSVALEPLPDGEAKVSIRAHAAGVSPAEVAGTLATALRALLRMPQNVTFETVDVIEARAQEAAFVQANPATRMFVRQGRVTAPLWLGESVPEDVVADILAAGWFEAPLPEQVKAKGCDYARHGAEGLLNLANAP